MRVILALILFIFSLCNICGGAFGAPASIASNVLEDLQKDDNFNLDDYPAVDNDYSLKVIQIAESLDGELFIYVYQPAAKSKFLKAVQINMSLSETVDDTKLYNLTLLNSSGVFQKYLIEGVTVSSESVRYYNITSIYRDWIKGIDKETDKDNLTNRVYFKVAKLYKAETVSNGIKYSCIFSDVVEIIEPYVDFISYSSPPEWLDLIFQTEKYTDIHYIAFSTDKQIDTLKEADVTYCTQTYKYARGETSYGSKSEPQYKTLTGEPKQNISIGKYTWKSILTSSDFINSTNLNDEAKKEVNKSEFVLVFLSTPYSQRSASDFVGHYTIKNGTKVSNVSILRLEFETEGKIYNLGAIMNQQEGDDIPGNQAPPESIGLFAYIWRCIVRLFKGTATLTEKIIAIFALCIVFLLLPIVVTVLSIVFPAFGAVVKQIFKIIGKALLCILKALWWLISAPFRGIAALIRKRQEATSTKAAPPKSRKTKTPKRATSKKKARTRSKTK